MSEDNTSKKKQPLASVSQLIREASGKYGEGKIGEGNKMQKEMAANWKRQLEEIKKVFHRRRFDLVENQATALIEQMDNFNEKSKPKMLCHWMIDIYFYRNFSRMELGNLHGAIADATKGLAILQLCKQIQEGDYSRTDDVEMQLLLDRGWSLLQLRNDLDAAYTDLKACRALILKGDECKLQPTTAPCPPGCDGQGTLQDVTAKLSIVMALQKAKSESSRPHYTPMEQESVEREFGFGIYAKKNHHCLGCGETKSLLLCSRCRGFWFCGKACVKKTWKTIHKVHCLECRSYPVHILSDEEKKEFGKRIKKDGYFHLADHADDTRVTIVLYDKKTGRYFDSLTDGEVVFVPSGMHRLTEEGRSDGLRVRCRVNVTGTMSDGSVGRFTAAMKAASAAHIPLRVVPNNIASHELKGSNPK